MHLIKPWWTALVAYSSFGAYCAFQPVYAEGTEVPRLALEDILPIKASTFQPDRWRSHQPNSSRPAMASDLIARHKIIGKTKLSLHNLLGNPDQSESQIDSYALNFAVCGNGPERFLDIDYSRNKATALRIREINHELFPPTISTSEWIR